MDRFNFVNRRVWVFSIVLALFAAGCGGGATSQQDFGPPGEVSGVVFDTGGNVVRNANVSTLDGSVTTISNSAGTYILHNVPAKDLIVQAQVSQGGVNYVGENLARVFSQERAKSVNIVVAATANLASVHGNVQNTTGGSLSGVRVLAIGENNLSSSMALTDNQGNFSIHNLEAGITYQISASTPSFQSSVTTAKLNPGEDRAFDFQLNDATGVGTLAAPTNVSAVAWTSPDDSTRSVGAASAYEQIKRLYDPKRATRTAVTRLTPSGDIVEIDLTWNPAPPDFLLGYGIYRAQGAAGGLVADDFLRDPLAQFYADADSSLQEQATYSYAMTSVNTDQTEGADSTRAVVSTLGPTFLQSPSFTPLTFHWNTVSGAQNYVVFLFDQEPRIGVTSIWNNAGSPVSGTSLAYSGPSLVPGHIYYYVVLSLANSNNSRSISPVDSFTF